jgi:hypothetical protein
MDIERKLDKTRAEAEKHAERDRVIVEQRAAERRAAEQRAAEQRAAEQRAAEQAVEQRAEDQRQTSEKWAAQLRYQRCVRRAEHDYEASWAAACKRVAAIENNTKEYVNCISGQVPKELCERWKSADASANCRLPRENADDINSTLERTRDHCLQEFKAGLQ